MQEGEVTADDDQVVIGGLLRSGEVNGVVAPQSDGCTELGRTHPTHPLRLGQGGPGLGVEQPDGDDPLGLIP